jgi:hypothetical protein
VHHTELSLDIIEAADLLCEGTLEGGRLRVELHHSVSLPVHRVSPPKLPAQLRAALWRTYVSKVHGSKLSKCGHDLAANLVGDVQLRQGHVRRAEHGVLWGRHYGSSRDTSSVKMMYLERWWEGRMWC